MDDHCGTVTPVVSLPHDKMMVLESNPEPIAARTGGSEPDEKTRALADEASLATPVQVY